MRGSWGRHESEGRHIVGLLDDLTSPPKERYAVSNDNVVQLIQPGAFQDQLTEVLRRGARDLLAQAVEAEVAEFLARHAAFKTDDGCTRVVRHGHLPEREVMTGIGSVAVRQPRVRDRQAAADDPRRIRFSPSLLPPYMRRSRSIETLLPPSAVGWVVCRPPSVPTRLRQIHCGHDHKKESGWPYMSPSKGLRR